MSRSRVCGTRGLGDVVKPGEAAGSLAGKVDDSIVLCEVVGIAFPAGANRNVGCELLGSLEPVERAPGLVRGPALRG